ncbi:hypothetical protein [Silvibacterium acidisoli]|uniref:hypothetical protein n=1 Tax=Acidobacteriaceae bacterium ZG23-2 TaxID=2883246 RepID=UPI00406CDD08
MKALWAATKVYPYVMGVHTEPLSRAFAFCGNLCRRSLVAASLAFCALSFAQVSYTSMPLDQGFGALDTSQPSLPVQQIIDQFTAKESVFREAMAGYTYQRSVKVETINDDGKPDGQYFQVVDISYDPSGRKMTHVVMAPPNTLERVQMTPADLQDIEERLPFVLTKDDVGQYLVSYVGKQKVDEVDTYVFDVRPKTIEKNKRYFQGRIWVDQHDLQIVVTNGKNVPDDLRKGHEDLSPPFTTYREQIDGKYWFPVYTKGDGILHFSGGNGYMNQDVHMRETVKYTNYKQFKSTIRMIFQGQDVSNSDNQQQPPAQQPPAQGKPQQ